MSGRITSRDDFMEKVGLVQISQLGKFPLSDIVHHKDIFQLSRSMSDVRSVAPETTGTQEGAFNIKQGKRTLGHLLQFTSKSGRPLDSSGLIPEM